MFEQGRLHNRESETHRQFAGQIQRIITSSAAYPVKSIFTGERGEKSGYDLPMHPKRSRIHFALSLLVALLAHSATLAQGTAQQANKPLLDSGQLTGALLQGFWESARTFWYVWLLLAAIVFGRLYLAYQRQAALAAAGIDEIDRMDGRAFEECLATMFRRLGYTVVLTPYAGDWGGDLVVQKAGVKTVVQAKRYKKAVGVRAVQEAVTAKAKYGCTEAMVVTNSVYTRQAEELARANRVTLWDRQRLVQALLSAKKEQTGESAPSNPVSVPATATASRDSETSRQAAPPLATAPVTEAQACFHCQKPVSDKVSAFCRANPQRFGGHIYCFEHQKQAARSERSTR